MNNIETVLEFLRTQPTLTLFLILGLGYVIGRIRIGAIDLGAVAGTLLTAIVLGRFGFRITPGAQAVGFALFMFAVGYQAGPRFFEVLRSRGLQYLALCLVVAAIGVATAVAANSILALPHGGLAGLLSGALTTTPMLAAAQEAVRSGLSPVPAGSTAEQVMATIGTSYAITYTVGMLGVILAIKLLPRIARVDLAAEAARFEQADTQRNRSTNPARAEAGIESPAGGAEDRGVRTDMMAFTFGIALGSAIGLLSINIAGIPIGLGTAGGLLVAGIAVGWVSSRRPTIGRFPEAARWILMEFGLLIFICGVGLQAGARIVEAFRESGVSLLIAAVFVVTLPVVGGYACGRWILRLPPIVLMGALTGAMTSAPSLSMLITEARSTVPALGYSGTYAFASVILTVIGTLVMVF